VITSKITEKPCVKKSYPQLKVKIWFVQHCMAWQSQ